MYAIMAAVGAFTPRLGLDLRGGTSITLTARPTTSEGTVTRTKLQEAAAIIANRVNGTGISEPEITTQGNDNIVVAVPGVNQDQIVKLVGQTAELRFRQVLYDMPAQAAPKATPTPTASPSPSATDKPSQKATKTPDASSDQKTKSNQKSDQKTKSDQKAKQKGSSDRYPAYAAGKNKAGTNKAGTNKAADSKATKSPKPTTEPSSNAGADLPIATQMPSQAEIAKLTAFTCAKFNRNDDRENSKLMTCDREGTTKYLLGPTLIDGTEVSDATAGIPANQVAWQVDFKLKSTGAKHLKELSTALYSMQPPLSQFAIVLDGKVVSAPVVQGVMPSGEGSITGNFTQQSATDLANVLKYGALPLSFDVSSIDSVSPLLGQDQLDGGLLAGALGLALVVVYCFLYYRGLGIVVTLSLGVAASISYAAVVLLGEAQGLTLTLAGIAGLIVSIGITADSFIVYFERLRDEARDGRSLRNSVEIGWIRARRTIFAADSVSLLAAVVLYALSIGSVRNFAYMLGLTTIVDLIVVMLFTKPLMSLLARTRFFGQGHRFSGLDPAHLGIRQRRAAARSRADNRPSSDPSGPPAIQEG